MSTIYTALLWLYIFMLGIFTGVVFSSFAFTRGKKEKPKKEKDMVKEAKEQLVGRKDYDYDEMYKIFQGCGLSVYPEVIKKLYGEDSFKKFEDEWDVRRKADNQQAIKDALDKFGNG